MPNRILREGILTSSRISKLGWPEEVFYRRLHSVVDDFGRYYADQGLLRAACYPRQLNKVSDSDIGKWLTVLVEAALVRVYPAEDGERYLEVLDFGQQVRAKKSKFPEMRSTCAADATQATCDQPANAPVFVSVSVDVKAPEARVLSGADLALDGVEPGIAAAWLQVRKDKKGGRLTQLAWDAVKREAASVGLTPAQAVRIAAESNWQGFKAAWLDKAAAKSSNDPFAGAA